MKVGDLVKDKSSVFSNVGLGLIIKVEKDFYRRSLNKNFCGQDRLTIAWIHGAITNEPEGYVEIVR